ncbi:MAG: UDP-N-acetylmuramate dehydrogenase [Acidobacteriota bacterium]
MTAPYPVVEQLAASCLDRDHPLGPWTTFGIGGPADLFYRADSRDELVRAVSAARNTETPYFLLGSGANILVGDRGFRGLVIHNRAARLELDGSRKTLWAESGATMYPTVIETAVGAGLSGLEHYVGIPSSVGGALWQNLHFLSPAPERERTMFIAEVLTQAEILAADGERRTVDADYFEFGYDYSILHDRDDIVLAATFGLEPADEARLRRVMAENLDWRRQRHPPLDREPSAGSIFKKIEGIGAGRLIDEAGLKGFTIGGAQISHRHANIVINLGGARARDVRQVIDHAIQVVADRTGYILEPEISFVGEF